jgi:hypothetical protein
VFWAKAILPGLPRALDPNASSADDAGAETPFPGTGNASPTPTTARVLATRHTGDGGGFVGHGGWILGPGRGRLRLLSCRRSRGVRLLLRSCTGAGFARAVVGSGVFSESRRGAPLRLLAGSGLSDRAPARGASPAPQGRRVHRGPLACRRGTPRPRRATGRHARPAPLFWTAALPRALPSPALAPPTRTHTLRAPGVGFSTGCRCAWFSCPAGSKRGWPGWPRAGDFQT